METETKINVDRQEIIDRIGQNIWNISGGRDVALPDGVYLPVANGYAVAVRLAANDTYTVQRLWRHKVKGEQTDVHCEELAEVAYRAACYLDVWGN